MIEIGRVCMKIAGRDAGQIGVVIDIADNAVILDGVVRRKKCNIKHIEPLKQLLNVEKNASHDEVLFALREAGFKIPEKKKRERKQKPVGKKGEQKAQPEAEKKTAKPASPKKEVKKSAEKKEEKREAEKMPALKE